MTEANENTANDPEATRQMGAENGASDSEPTSTDLTGRTFDDFRILRKLGSGGMAAVYLADQMSLGRRVAIKLMSPSLTSDADVQRSLARFRTEAMAAAALTHPNIVQVYTVGESEGMPYIAMEYVPGRNLSDVVKRQGPLKIKLALHVIRQAARALSAAHAAGVIHRDIKPANILVSPKGDVKVADFGLSQLTSGPLASPGLTQTGTTVGTPRYMSPEQIEGRTVDARTDLYSLGVTLFFVLAGRPPFDSPSPMVLASQHLRDDPPSIRDFRSDIPDSIVELIDSTLEKSVNDRIATADDVVRELGAIIAQLSPAATDHESLAEISAASTTQSSASAKPASRRKSKAKKSTQSGLSKGGLVVTGLLATVVGIASAGLLRPADPLRGAGEVEKLDSAREQFVDAMLSGNRRDFLAVETLWPGETEWVWRAREQRLLDALADSGSRQREANDLINRFSSDTSEEHRLIATVAEVALLAYEGKATAARRQISSERTEKIRSLLDPVWVDLWEEADAITTSPGQAARSRRDAEQS